MFACSKESGGGAAVGVAGAALGTGARRPSPLLPAAQPDAGESRRLSRLPQGRPAPRARTVPLLVRRPSPASSSSSTAGSPPSAGPASRPATASGRGAAAAAPAPALQPRPASGCSAAQPACSAGSGAPADEEAAGGGTQQCPQAALVVPVPLPLAPCGGTAPQQAAGDCAGEATSSSSSAGTRGSTTVGGDEGAPAACQACADAAAPCQRALPPPLLSVHSKGAAAVWRAQWLQGLQHHNAARSGQPIRAGSRWHFIPLDPNDPLLPVLMYSTAVMPAQVIAGAARFQDVLLGSPERLYPAALAAGVLSYGVWRVAAPDGSQHLLAEGKQLALPISFRRAPPHLVALFLACVWHEANRAEAAQHLTYTFAASGERVADEASLKYSPGELLEWVRLVLGCEQAAHESVAALAHVAQFGAQ